MSEILKFNNQDSSISFELRKQLDNQRNGDNQIFHQSASDVWL